MAAKLAFTVTVKDPKTREIVSFGPDDELPAWAEEQITFEGAYVPSSRQGKQEEPPFDPADDLGDDQLPNLKVDQLKAYADAHGVEVAASAKKDELIAAITAAQ
ncbi:Rho termination factor N-terminal domain-containing protein [Kocuria rosea]|uniref:Rho termination factor N-terminal domain-containing protein n=1 Tax=Kocuria rosea TaxID=1275 RepID=UPI0011A4A6DC|nr:Rho termination factor N-terminal domain-containing protein [Kocuria rosea]